jgi:tRNA(fMet)-specific endonuclease VapC
MPYLIDTDILIYSLKNNPVVHNNFMLHEHDPKAISVISYGELLIGAKKSVHIDKNLAVAYRIRELFPVISVDQPVIETFSNIKTALQHQGTPIDDMDLLIASTALTLNYVLVTNNEKHFKRIDGLLVENWCRG